MATHSDYGATTSSVRQKKGGMVEEGRQKAGEIAKQAQQQAEGEATKRKSQAASQLDDVAQAFRETGQQLRHRDKAALADYTDKVAEQVEQVTGYLDEKDLGQILSDAEDFARRQPELFLGSAFTLGLLAARFIRSSPRRRQPRYSDGWRREAHLEDHDRYETPLSQPETYPSTAPPPNPGGRHDLS